MSTPPQLPRLQPPISAPTSAPPHPTPLQFTPLHPNPLPDPHPHPLPARRLQVLLNEVEEAGEEPAEGLLRARVACVASLREGTDRDETAFESFCVPPSPRRHAITSRGATTTSLTQGGADAGAAGAGAAAESSGRFDEEREAGVGGGVEAESKTEGFMSFRVANKDNEVSHFSCRRLQR